MFRSIRQIVALGAFCLTATAAAPTPAWTVARNANFEVYSDAGPQTAHSTLAWFEQLRAFFLRQTGLSTDNQSVRIIVFRSADEYNQFRPSASATAFYVGNSIRNYIVMEQSRSASAAIAAHEYAHSLMHANGLHFAPWLSEGLSDIFSSVQIGERASSIGGDLPGRSQMLRRTTWTPLASLLAATDDRGQSEMFYAESWALAHMLVFSPEYSSRFAALISALASGTPGPQALTGMYAKTLDAIARDLQNWVATPVHFEPVPLGGIAVRVLSAESAELSSFDQRLLMADLLFTSGELERAQKLYRELQRELPSNPDVSIALGEIALRNADSKGALRAWRQGIEAGTRDARLCFRYAVVAEQAGIPDAEIRPVLEHAVELDPGFDDARYHLALLEINTGEFEAGVQQLRAMKRVPPARAYSWWSAMANALNELDRREEGKRAAQEAGRHATTAEERAHAAQLAYIADTDVTVQFTHDASGAAHVVTTRIPHNASAWNPFVEPGDRMRRVDGLLRNIDCSGTSTRIEVKSAGERLTLSIPDPSRVQMRNGPPEFTCGPQSAQVIVDYASQNGVVRSIEFK